MHSFPRLFIVASNPFQVKSLFTDVVPRIKSFSSPVDKDEQHLYMYIVYIYTNLCVCACVRVCAVSYTHLDVYKRQPYVCSDT